jgi:hypothetical protein
VDRSECFFDRYIEFSPPAPACTDTVLAKARTATIAPVEPNVIQKIHQHQRAHSRFGDVSRLGKERL